ncbi:MAG: DUF211 domain-containing protein [Haloferacaceae archaeon]
MSDTQADEEPVVVSLVLDLLKPHEPDLATFARGVAQAPGVTTVVATRAATDREVETVEVAVEGTDLDLDAVEAQVVDLGGSVHSVDEVVCRDRDTP